MQKQLVGLGVVVLMFGSIACATAALIDQGDGTIYDNGTGNYWQQNVEQWGNMTYQQQIDDISNNHVGWHMANYDEMQLFLANNYYDIITMFYQTWGDRGIIEFISGRYDYVEDLNLNHNTAKVSYMFEPINSGFVTEGHHLNDTERDYRVGAWVVRDSAPVPEPSTMLLFGSGLAGLIGSRTRRNSDTRKSCKVCFLRFKKQSLQFRRL